MASAGKCAPIFLQSVNLVVDTCTAYDSKMPLLAPFLCSFLPLQALCAGNSTQLTIANPSILAETAELQSKMKKEIIMFETFWICSLIMPFMQYMQSRTLSLSVGGGYSPLRHMRY